MQVKGDRLKEHLREHEWVLKQTDLLVKKEVSLVSNGSQNPIFFNLCISRK
jgi:hypothetical protein